MVCSAEAFTQGHFHQLVIFALRNAAQLAPLISNRWSLKVFADEFPAVMCRTPPLRVVRALR